MSTKGQMLSVRCGRMVGLGRVKYQGRWVCVRWYNRYVLKQAPTRRPYRKHEPILARFYMPPINRVGEPAMEWLVDLTCKARVREVMAVQDAYAMPPARELPTFFPPMMPGLWMQSVPNNRDEPQPPKN